jgi:hypothetical protein
MEVSKTLNSKSNSEQKEQLKVSQYWTSNYTTDHSNKISMVPAQKQIEGK